MVAWEKRLMVVGDAPESIQYPWKQLVGCAVGRTEGVGFVTCPAPPLGARNSLDSGSGSC